MERPVLPPELWVLILENLPTEDLCNARFICSAWRQLADHDSIWQARCQTTFGKSDLECCATWREQFIDLFKKHNWAWVPQSHLIIDEQDPNLVMCELHQGASLSSSYGPARIVPALPDTATKPYFFEISIRSPINSLGVGLCDETVDNMAFFISGNNGTGYYAFGKVWTDGRSDDSYPAFSLGDKVGMLVHPGQKWVQFFLNRAPVKERISLAWTNKPLHVVCLMSIRDQVRFEGFRSPPEEVKAYASDD